MTGLIEWIDLPESASKDDSSERSGTSLRVHQEMTGLIECTNLRVHQEMTGLIECTSLRVHEEMTGLIEWID